MTETGGNGAGAPSAWPGPSQRQFTAVYQSLSDVSWFRGKLHGRQRDTSPNGKF